MNVSYKKMRKRCVGTDAMNMFIVSTLIESHPVPIAEISYVNTENIKILDLSGMKNVNEIIVFIIRDFIDKKINEKIHREYQDWNIKVYPPIISHACYIFPVLLNNDNFEKVIPYIVSRPPKQREILVSNDKYRHCHEMSNIEIKIQCEEAILTYEKTIRL